MWASFTHSLIFKLRSTQLLTLSQKAAVDLPKHVAELSRRRASSACSSRAVPLNGALRGTVPSTAVIPAPKRRARAAAWVWKRCLIFSFASCSRLLLLLLLLLLKDWGSLWNLQAFNRQIQRILWLKCCCCCCCSRCC